MMRCKCRGRKRDEMKEEREGIKADMGVWKANLYTLESQAIRYNRERESTEWGKVRSVEDEKKDEKIKDNRWGNASKGEIGNARG